MELDTRSAPPPLGPRPITAELPTNTNWNRADHAGASGSSGPASGGSEGQASAAATGTANSAPGLGAPRNQASTPASVSSGLVSGGAGGHASSASSFSSGHESGGLGDLEGAVRPCWGSLTALHEPGGRALFDARIRQLVSGHKWLFHVRMVPVNDDHAQPTDARFIRNAIACFLEAQLVNDAGLSISRDSIKSGAIRPTRLSGWSPDERLFSFECHLDPPANPTSTFMRHMLARISGGKSMLDPLRESNWVWIRAGLAKSTTPPPEYADA